MTNNDADKLRRSAYRFRLMAEDGDDLHLKVVLMKLAEEFEREAADLDHQDNSAERAEAANCSV